MSILLSLKQLMKSFQVHGFKGTLLNFYRQSEVKGGTLVGKDQFGNKYFEDLTEQYGKHRWVEYNKPYHQMDVTSVPPEWHGWLHYMNDKPGNIMKTYFWRAEHQVNPSSSTQAHLPPTHPHSTKYKYEKPVYKNPLRPDHM